MAEFHAAGFSEFDKFFGGETSKEKEESKDALLAKGSKESKTTGKGRRGGVGSKASTLSSTAQSSTVLSKRLLKVGTKRSRNRDADLDEEEEYTNDDRDSEQDDDDGEEDIGRTGISLSKESSLAKSKTNDVLDQLQPSKKKKQGKKERQRLKEEADKKAEEIIRKDEVGGESTENNNADDVDGEATNAKRKPKRRKIRSRQKNIRKDSRGMGEKPKHLRVGASNYQGRPLTDETRARLNLAPSKTKASPFFVIDRAPTPKVEEGIALGVEDLLAEPAAVEGSSTKKKKKKKSKRKYKNL
ncbi:unnamed protein product [Cylindrotheca closterium]|uniref:Uncharacterized protein n=1 Tax=Cylindrotheca closterium TaxID=2856 RepID=A0AAD2CEZ9_9STRA|nr:unnamed protein product [Cylindrotheca closterium]